MCRVQTHKTYHRSHMCAIPYRRLCKRIRIGKIDCWFAIAVVVVDFVFGIHACSSAGIAVNVLTLYNEPVHCLHTYTLVSDT